MLFHALSLLVGGIVGATAIPIQIPRGTLTAASLQVMAPATASCSGAPFPDECRDASQAVGPIVRSFANYRIASVGEQAALLALMLYESGNFKYSKNHYPAPGRPGQGTRNMQMAPFNLLYAQSLFDPSTVQAAQAQGPAAVLDLVNGDNESFGSAAWFLTSQCTPNIRQGLASGMQAGWTAYLTQCVGTTDNAERDAIWMTVWQNMIQSY